MLIEPPADRDVKTGKNHNSPAQSKTRKDFYDWLAQQIKIDGISTSNVTQPLMMFQTTEVRASG